MRWERLFADLEGQAEDEALAERDALAADLRDEHWGSLTWRAMLGDSATLEVVGVGRVAGEVVAHNATFVHLRTPALDHVAAVEAVAAVVATQGDPLSQGVVTERLGWAQVCRRVRDDADEVRLGRVDGPSHDGVVDVVGRDFVRLRAATATTATVVVPFAAIAVLSIRR